MISDAVYDSLISGPKRALLLGVFYPGNERKWERIFINGRHSWFLCAQTRQRSLWDVDVEMCSLTRKHREAQNGLLRCLVGWTSGSQPHRGKENYLKI